MKKTSALLALLLLAAPAGAAQRQVGEAEFARGAAAAQFGNEAPRILGKGAKVYEKDVIQTGPRSFVILKFEDAAKVTLRPNSKLTVDQYLGEQASLSLHKGGIRAQSGAISRNQPGAFKLETPVGTVEVNDAEFDARLCETDCDEEAAKKPEEPKPELDTVVGRVALMKGLAEVTGNNERVRKLKPGAPLVEGDLVSTRQKSNALLVFRDQAKVTLQDNSEYQVLAQKYYSATDARNESVHKFIRGGMRKLTGVIGQNDPSKVTVSTPVATTGIRGTGFDLNCQGGCEDINFQGNQLRIGEALPDGLYSLVWRGAIFLRNASGEYDIGENQSGYLANDNTPLIVLPLTPAFLSNNPHVRPDRAPVDMQHLFGKEKLEGNPPGLYVRAREGHVTLVTESGSEIDLGTNETGYVNFTGTTLIRLEFPRNFLNQDVYPVPSATLNDDLFTLLDDDDLARTEFFECLCPI